MSIVSRRLRSPVRWSLISVPLLAICAVAAGEITVERLNQAEKEPHNWLIYGGTYKAWRYSPLDQIHASNVQRLAAVWAFQAGMWRVDSSALRWSPTV
jgi:glucose dehydrogenase